MSLDFFGQTTNTINIVELYFVGQSTDTIHKPEISFFNIGVVKPIICELSTFGPSCDPAPPSVITYQFT